MDMPIDVKLVDFGVTMAVLIVVYRAIALASQLYASKKIPPLACQQDPKHFQRIMEIHRMTADTEKQKDAGAYKCLFKDRDEVRDLLDIMRKNVEATEALTLEMRLTRNGGSPTTGRQR